VPDAVIDNPIINSPYREPSRHFRFTDDGITEEVVEGRRRSEYLIPIPPSKHKGHAQLAIETEHMPGRRQENELINQIRDKVAIWRKGGYVGVTRTTRLLLEHWTREDRDKRLFFCQIEAVETVIYLTEVAHKYNDAWIENRLVEVAADHNPDLIRMALKMATGAGKTIVMAMLIAWHVLNKANNPQDARFTDAFLIACPGITIRDRLRVLLPSDPENYYGRWDVVPPDMREDIGRAKIVITNYHTFLRREKIAAGKLTKSILTGDAEQSPFTETPEEMARRVCRELGTKKNIIVINDEAHHCYRPKPSDVEESLKGDDLKEAKRAEEEARVWISGLEAINRKIGIKAVYDLSATPFFLKGSGYAEGTLFPWVVSDFSLIDAIESGIVKIPRVPVADDSMTGDAPLYRELWLRIREHLPRKGRAQEKLSEDPQLPTELEGAIQSLYSNYRKYYDRWEAAPKREGRIDTPPVFIVVCNNTNVSKLVFDYIAGWDRTLPDGTVVPVPGKLPLFSNIDGGLWTARPNSILIDSEQLETGGAMSDDFKAIAAREIQEFKNDYRQRFPGRDVDKLEDEDLLREVMNTVGKAGKLGEQVKCVVSVSMLTEGWDANTVTHILGVRAFGTQLLCEQVVGRALRRISYAVDDDDMLQPEYAEVYGVPFSFIPSGGEAESQQERPVPTRIRALDERIDKRIEYPRVMGYRYELPSEKLTAKFTDGSKMALSTESLPTSTEIAGVVGETEIHTLDDLKAQREQSVVFGIADRTLRKLQTDGEMRPWLFPSLLAITREWLATQVKYKDDTFPQLLLLAQLQEEAARKIYQAVVRSQEGEKRLLPILRPYDSIGSTSWVDFDTVRPVFQTSPDKCHVSHVMEHSRWEGKVAQSLEDMPEVLSYVKNDGMGFTIPYTIDGEERNYFPDFILRVKAGEEIINLIVEVTGEKKRDKHAKVDTAQTLWVPAVNNDGRFGVWRFLEIQDPYEAKALIRGTMTGDFSDRHQLIALDQKTEN
jgi:type III restriction enzyme